MIRGTRYAVVAYVNDPVGEFVEGLRQELHPHLPHMPAHLSLLPPRPLEGNEASAVEIIREVCSRIEPFDVSLGEVETFIPVTPTVFIRVAHGASRMRELHELLSAGPLSTPEDWPYLPHLTIAKMGAEDQAQEAYRLARRYWSEFKGSRTIQTGELTFVRENGPNCWLDLAKVPLARLIGKSIPSNQ